MKEFEEACQEFNSPLYILPPKRPQYNGGVERGNRIVREKSFTIRKSDPRFKAVFEIQTSQAVIKLKGLRPDF